MDAQSAGRAARSLELLHSLSYFVPEVGERLAEVGLEPGRMGYFAGRAAPMGAVNAGVVTAAFFNFSPDAVAAVIPRAWDLAAPHVIVEARYRAVGEAYVRLLGESVIASPEMAEAADLLSTAARGIPGVEGRPLYAGYAALEWPSAPHLSFWHALTVLREYRGDGHTAALQTAGLSGLEALITHTATGRGFQKKFALTRRGWSEDQWNAACDSLRDRELLDARGELTADGSDLRNLIEDLTDDIALTPWAALGEDGVARVVELATPWRDTVVAAGVFPAGVFGPKVRTAS
ncbi:hypothetical protein ACH47B_19190 [Rhodococcus sp. NPDC019627]|uniref:SCO6745 family protein n=1 Tax=Rhodococcus TaxID=1827 RepID=UPI0029548034|nr:hypothetical protein [Rhodococcus oxybenzonivorans]MDV7356266.1 hypothetical protein [Rhodococcus oxybenzonivorans]